MFSLTYWLWGNGGRSSTCPRFPIQGESLAPFGARACSSMGLFWCIGVILGIAGRALAIRRSHHIVFFACQSRSPLPLLQFFLARPILGFLWTYIYVIFQSENSMKTVPQIMKKLIYVRILLYPKCIWRSMWNIDDDVHDVHNCWDEILYT